MLVLACLLFYFESTMFQKKKKTAPQKAQLPAFNDVGMTVIQEFLTRRSGDMKSRSGKSNAHILSENDGVVADAAALLSMRLTASEKRFRGCSHNWSDSVRQQFVAHQQLLLAHADQKNYFSLRNPPPQAARPRARLSSHVLPDDDGNDIHDKQMFSIMADGLQLVGDALFAMFASDIHVERRVLTQDLLCEDLAEQFAWDRIQLLEGAEVANSRIDSAALTFAVFSQFASRCSALVQESAPACRHVVQLGAVIPLVRLCQDPPCVPALIDSLACLVSLLSSDSGRGSLFDFGGFEAIVALLSTWLELHLQLDKDDKKSVAISETCEVDEQNTLFMMKGALNCIIGICTGPAIYRVRLLDLGCAGVLFSVLRSCSVDAVLRLAATAVVALGCDDPVGDSSLNLSHDDVGFFDGVVGRVTRADDEEQQRAASEPALEPHMALSNLTHSSFHALTFLNQAARHAVAAAFESVLDSTAMIGRRPVSSAASSQALPPMQVRNRTQLQERNKGTKLFGGGMRAPDQLLSGKHADDGSVHSSVEEARARSKAASVRSRVASSVVGQNTVLTASTFSQDVRSVRAALLDGHHSCSARIASVGTVGTEALCALVCSDNCSNALLAQCCSCLCLICKMSEPNRESVCSLGAIPPIISLLNHKNSRCVAAATAILAVLTKSSVCRKAVAACGGAHALVAASSTGGCDIRGSTSVANIHAVSARQLYCGSSSCASAALTRGAGGRFGKSCGRCHHVWGRDRSQDVGAGWRGERRWQLTLRVGREYVALRCAWRQGLTTRL